MGDTRSLGGTSGHRRTGPRRTSGDIRVQEGTDYTARSRQLREGGEPEVTPHHAPPDMDALRPSWAIAQETLTNPELLGLFRFSGGKVENMA